MRPPEVLLPRKPHLGVIPLLGSHNLGGPPRGVQADRFTSEMLQCKKFSVEWLSVISANCLLIVC